MLKEDQKGAQRVIRGCVLIDPDRLVGGLLAAVVAFVICGDGDFCWSGPFSRLAETLP